MGEWALLEHFSKSGQQSVYCANSAGVRFVRLSDFTRNRYQNSGNFRWFACHTLWKQWLPV